MKISITASVLILAIGVALGLIHQKRLKNLCEDQRQLVAQAGKLGISCDPPTSSGDPRIHHRPHENRDNSARAMTAELVALAKEMELQQKGAAEPDEAFQAKMPEMMLRMLALDASQLKLALAGMRDDPSVSEETRRNLIGYSLLILSEDDRGIIHTLGVAGLCDGQAFPRLTHRVDEISMVRRDFDLLAGGGKHHLALAGVAEK